MTLQFPFTEEQVWRNLLPGDVDWRKDSLSSHIVETNKLLHLSIHPWCHHPEWKKGKKCDKNNDNATLLTWFDILKCCHLDWKLIYVVFDISNSCDSFYRTQVSLVRSMDPSVSHWLTHRPCADLTDVTLADEDTNSILAVNANRAIQGNVAMQVAQPGGQPSNFGQMTKFWSDLQQIRRCIFEWNTN